MLDKHIWSKRLAKEKLRRLYMQNAEDLVDSALLQDVALTLYLRCKDIMAVYAATKEGKVRCPLCYGKGLENYLHLPQLPYRERAAYILSCAHCGGSFSMGEFHRSYKEQQLNPGGAVPAFKRFITQYEQRPDDRKLMLEVDRLIHEFHYNQIKNMQAPAPTRSTGPNLIEGNLTDIIAFLDELSKGQQDEIFREQYEHWKEKLDGK